MPFYQTNVPPRTFQAPFVPLAQAHQAQGRLRVMPIIADRVARTADEMAMSLLLQYAHDLAAGVRANARHANLLAMRDNDDQARSHVAVSAQAAVAAAHGNIDHLQFYTDNTPFDARHLEIPRLMALNSLLASATDGDAVQTLLAMVRNYPEQVSQNQAMVSAAQRIRDENSLHNQPPGPLAELPEGLGISADAQRLLQELADSGSASCRANETSIVRAHNANLAYRPSPAVLGQPEVARQADEFMTTPNSHHHLSLHEPNQTVHLVIFEYLGMKIAKELWEPYPPDFPAPLAIDQMQSLVRSQAISDDEESHAAHTAHAVSILAVLNLHNLRPQSLVNLVTQAGSEAANTLLTLTTGERAAAKVLAKQAGYPDLALPANLPNPRSARAERVMSLISAHLNTMAARTIAARLDNS